MRGRPRGAERHHPLYANNKQALPGKLGTVHAGMIKKVGSGLRDRAGDFTQPRVYLFDRPHSIGCSSLEIVKDSLVAIMEDADAIMSRDRPDEMRWRGWAPFDGLMRTKEGGQRNLSSLSQ